MSDKSNSEYLGDGVYLRDDGYQLWLAANDHRNDVIALEPGVCLALIRKMTRVLPFKLIEQTVADMKPEPEGGKP